MTAPVSTPSHAGDRRVTVGIDLGGTGTRIVALGPDGTVRNELTLATPHTSLPSNAALDELVQHIRAISVDSELIAVGIGASGPIDARGVIRNPDTLPAFTGITVAERLADELGVPCTIDNDTVAAAIGENTYGAGHHSPALLMITLGTGIGACFLAGGAAFRGSDRIHPEAGHLPVNGPIAPCYCGLATCWEQLASRSALDTLTHSRTSQLAALATRGDSQAITVFEEYGRRVGSGTSALVTIFRPERIVFGGSAARYLPLFAPGLEQALNRRGAFLLTPPYSEAQLGALSGAIGAGAMAAPKGN
jgi:glucokinase